MYHGTQRVRETRYWDKYLPGIGTVRAVKDVVSVQKHCYTCDGCDRRYAFSEAAEEPFYCRCGQEVSLEAAQP